MFKETIILAPGANSAELSRSIANTFCTRIFSTLELAQFLLMRSGVAVEEEFLPSNEIPNIIYSFGCRSYTDAKNYAEAFHTMMILCKFEDIKPALEKSQFREKNKKLYSLFLKYRDYLKDNNLIDSDGIIHKAIDEAKKLDVVTFKEFPLSPIDKMLAANIEEKSLAKCQAKPTYIKAYGSVNEAKYIISDIINNHNLDECVIACNNNLIFHDFDIPMTFSDGESIARTNPAKLLKLIAEWERDNYFGVDGLRNILKSPECNFEGDVEEIAVKVGNLRSGYGNLLEFLNKYCVLRPNTNDEAALNAISEFIENFLKYNPEASYLDILDEVLSLHIGSELAEPGKVHVTSINGALSCHRDKLYVFGLDASSFPGRAVESYLLLDEDLKCLNPDAITSVKKLDMKLKQFNDLMTISSNPTLSYSSINLADVKPQNPASVLFGAKFKEVNYFTDEIDPGRAIGKAIIDNKDLSFTYKEFKQETPNNLLDRSFSASAIDDFTTCPMKFYFKRVMNIYPDSEDDPKQVIPALNFGILAHELMEYLAKNKVTFDEFKVQCENAFEKFLVTRPPLFKDEVGKEKRDFMKAMANAYKQSADKDVISAEHNYEAIHKTGVKLKGRPDRVETDGILVDFKTGRNIVHEQNDLETCVQVIVYAWLCEQAGLNIDTCEYRYLRRDKIVTCEYGEYIKDQLTEKLELLANCAKTNEWRIKGKCKYCDYEGICQSKTGKK